MDTIRADVKNRRLTDAYYSSCYYASRLRVYITSKDKVSKVAFRNFKGAFDYLFQISYNRMEFKGHEELIKKVHVWLISKNKKPNVVFVENGLSLFDEYQKAINDLSLISDSQ